MKNAFHKLWNGIKKHRKKLLIILVCFVVAHPILILPTATVIIYESVFGTRYETPSWMQFSVEEYPGLSVERSDFQSGDITLAGYRYVNSDVPIKGVVVLAHGMGGGGHNTYMPFIDSFTSNGYGVFAYDAHGNDNSGGGSVKGLPQGIIDLDNAIRHVKSLEDYRGLPIMLFGHSWGGYSVGNVLGMHPDVKAAVIVAGFNESEDLLRYQGESVSHTDMTVVMPYLELYERIKFGSAYSDISAIESMKQTDAAVMVIHSKDDATVPVTYGYDKFHAAFGDSDRFEFVLYEDRGHSYLFYSDEAQAYRATLNENYTRYVEENGLTYNEAVKEEFMNQNLDKQQCFDPDPDLMKRILDMFDRQCLA